METYLLIENGATYLGNITVESAARFAESLLDVKLYNETNEKEVQTKTSHCGKVRVVSFESKPNRLSYVLGITKSRCCNKEVLLFAHGKTLCSHCFKESEGALHIESNEQSI